MSEIAEKKPLQKPARAKKLKKVARKARKIMNAKKRKTAPRDQSRLYRLAGRVKIDEIRSPILKAMVKAVQKRKTATIDELAKATGKSLPSKADDTRAVVAWRVRHSGLFVAAGHRKAA